MKIKFLVAVGLVAAMTGCAMAPAIPPEKAAKVNVKGSEQIRIVEVDGKRAKAQDDIIVVEAGKRQFKVACASEAGTVHRYAWGNIKPQHEYMLEVDDVGNCYTMIKQK